MVDRQKRACKFCFSDKCLPILIKQAAKVPTQPIGECATQLPPSGHFNTNHLVIFLRT